MSIQAQHYYWDKVDSEVMLALCEYQPGKWTFVDTRVGAANEYYGVPTPSGAKTRADILPRGRLIGPIAGPGMAPKAPEDRNTAERMAKDWAARTRIVIDFENTHTWSMTAGGGSQEADDRDTLAILELFVQRLRRRRDRAEQAQRVLDACAEEYAHHEADLVRFDRIDLVRVGTERKLALLQVKRILRALKLRDPGGRIVLDRPSLQLGKYTRAYANLSPEQLQGLLWLVGEWSVRAQTNHYHPRAKAALRLLTDFGSEPLTLEQVKAEMRAAVTSSGEEN